MSGQPAQTLATHLLNQTLSSIAVLETLNVISSSDAHLIRSKLPSPTGPFPSLNPQPDISHSFGNLSVSPANSYNNPPSHEYSPRPPQSYHSQGQNPPPALPPRARGEQRAKALWDYNGGEADDLSFRQGDVLIIDEEVNEQWYRGRVIPNGQQHPIDRSGLFPTNYIEKISTVQSPPYYQNQPNQMVPYNSPNPPSQYGYEKPPNNYGPPAIAPPPQHGSMMPYQQQPQQQQVVVAQEEKKSKFGKIGGQLGNAAVNGAGFGFGASIASEMVHKIF